MIFATFELSKDPPQFADFPGLFAGWLQDFGTMAALALLVWGISYLLEKRATPGAKNAPVKWLFLSAIGLSVIGYLAFFVLWLLFGFNAREIVVDNQKVRTMELTVGQGRALTAAGGFALLAVALPMIVGLVGRMRWRRIWALSRLSMKEAIRGRVLYVFCLMGLVFLFYGYFVSYKPEDQIRNYVTVIHTSMAPLFLVTAALLGAFSIPNDVVRQTIHTVVTKPVERYEIVLGRFLGYGLLLSAILAILTLLSLFYILRGVNPEAEAESGKARVPIYSSSLGFWGTGNEKKGEDVGREWTYRSYIRGRSPGESETRGQMAIWSFDSLPDALADRDRPVPFEFTFDIFRTNKGKEDQGVVCNLYFVDGRFGVEEMKKAKDNFGKDMEQQNSVIEQRWNKERESLDRRQQELKKRRATTAADKQRLKEDRDRLEQERTEVEQKARAEADAAVDQLIEKHGIYFQNSEVTDYHTQSLKVPISLFKRLRVVADEIAQSSAEGPAPPVLKVLVEIDPRNPAGRGQLVGVARRDLYLLAAELPFWQNFLKGMMGLWFNVLLVLAIAVACSTYLSGIISLLCTLFLLGAGALVEFIRSLALGTAVGGGPFEAANRMFHRLPPGAPVEQTTAMAVSTDLDSAHRWLLTFVLKLIPDIHRFNLTQYVAEGFDIPWINVLLLDNVWPLLSFMIPLGILAYYLMNSREVANPT